MSLRGRTIRIVTSHATQTLTIGWDGQTADPTPDFSVVGPIELNDRITLSLYDDVGLTNVVAANTNLIETGDEQDGNLVFYTGSMVSGNYFARMTQTRNGQVIGYSNSANITIQTFDPLTLFEGGTYKGFYFDAANTSQIFQTTTMASPVTTDGQSVQRINDQWGNVAFTIGGTGDGIYGTDGTYHWIVGGTANRLRSTNTKFIQGASAVTVFAALRMNSSGSEKVAFTSTNPSFVQRVTLGMGGANQPLGRAQRSDSGGTTTILGTTTGITDDVILWFEMDYVNNDANIAKGSIIETTNLNFIANAGIVDATDGTQTDIALNLNGRLYALFVINRLLTTTEKNNLGATFAGKCSATY
jgi:hypothetical protein